MGFCTHNLYVKRTKIGSTHNLILLRFKHWSLKNRSSQNIDEKRSGPAQLKSQAVTARPSPLKFSGRNRLAKSEIYDPVDNNIFFILNSKFNSNVQKQKQFLILIPFLIPLVHFVTDHIFAISTAKIVNDSSVTSAVAWAMIFNLWLGPI